MYITITAYNRLEANMEDWDTIPIEPSGEESASIEKGMYTFDEQFEFQILYDQLSEFKKLGSDLPWTGNMDIGTVLGTKESRSLRDAMRKAGSLINEHIENESFFFTFSNLLAALECASDGGAVIFS